MPTNNPMTESPQRAGHGPRRLIVVLRIVLAVGLVPALVYLCLQTEHARVGGSALECWRLVPLILTAAACALFGKRLLNSIAGLFLSGIGGRCSGRWTNSLGRTAAW